MAIDTETKRRSVSGYSGIIIAPVADGTIGAADREHVAGLYRGIGITPPEAPYQGDAYMYNSAGGTAGIAGGTVLEGPNQNTPTGSVSGGTILDGPNQSSPTGSITGGTSFPPDQIYD